ncbi:PHD finger protein 20-like isoform X2 [Dreissena polymorpha]|uniref:PHD finger protein 20-like isoform X2 n=1 Tax=Dreissena polymorpha TaxID=45954 RepID=UPI00226533CB|nr:PHD finger protein 20-like isoform X2 [Dreissena polymorpha]
MADDEGSAMETAMECHVLQKADGSSENLAEDSDKYTCHIPTTVSSMDGTFGHLPVQQSVANTALDGTDLSLNEQDMLEEPFTPTTNQTGSSKSQPESGRETPASQSDHSMSLSSSEKSTPIRVGGLKVEDNVSCKQRMKFPQRQGIHWRKGEKLEAMDFQSVWFPAKIREVREDEMKVLVHFDGWNQRFDEWLDMNSDRIRPLVRTSERKEKSKRVKTCPLFLQDHKIGEQVYAKWTDCKMYPAKITNILPNGSYEVIFYDGYKKLVQPINVRSMPGENKNFEIPPNPDPVVKRQKLKVSTTERSRSLSGELMRHDIGLEAPTLEKKKPGKPRRKRQTFDGADLASIVNSLDSPSPNVALQQLVGEPVSTQTEYTEQNVSEDSAVPTETKAAVDIDQLLPPNVPLASVGSPKFGPTVLPPKAFVVESDHNPYKCTFDGCTKGFRKEHLLEYHIKYYHMTDGEPPPPPVKKRRRKTTSICSNESEQMGTTKRSDGKKNRNFSAECATVLPKVELEQPDSFTCSTPGDTGEISTQTSPMKPYDPYTSEDSSLGTKAEVKTETRSLEGLEDSSVTDAEEFLKPDELVNCICDYQEENGLMIQCEVCMCWQHAACFGITERTLPKTYVCFVCENPPGVRESSKYIHEQDWFKTGEIASFNFLNVPPMSEEKCSTVKATHNLVSEIHHLNTVLFSLKLQLKIIRTKDESKLKQWRLDWDVYDPLQDTIESCPPPGADKPEIKTEPVDIDLKGDNCATSVLPDISMGNCSGGVVIKQECQTGSDMTSADLVSPRNVNLSESSSDNIATNHNTNNCPVDGNNSSNNLSENVESNALLSREICRSNGQEAQTSVSSNLGDQHGEQLTNNEQHRQVVPSEEDTGTHSDSTESVVEDPVEVCEKNLISHILRVQGEISERLDKIEEEVTMLEAMEACQSRRPPVNPQLVLNDMPQLKHSMRNMCSDLTKVKKMSVFHYQV